MGIIAETSLFTNTPGPNAAEGLEALRQNQLAIRELSGALPPESLTVVDGAISPTRSTVIIDTEGGAPADDLEVINPVLSDSTTLHDGMVIELVGKDDSRVVTVKHGSGQNQISLVDQEDIALSTQYALRLQWDAQAALWRQRIFSQPLKPATALKLGGVKIGPGITIAPDGTISIPTPDDDFFRIIEGEQRILSLSAALASELAEQKALRLRDIGCPRWWRSTNLPPNHAWINGDFIAFKDWPEFHEVYTQGGFDGMVMPWDADEEHKAAHLGQFRPDSANPTGLFLPVDGGQFFRNWCPAGAATAPGAWSPDSGRNLTGQVDYLLGTTSGGITSGCFSETTQRPPVAVAEGQAHHQIVLNFDAATVWGEHAGAEFVPPHVWQPVCLYLGRPTQV